MPLSPDAVAAASNAWIFTDNATVVDDEQYKIARYPDYFDQQLAVLEFRPSGPTSAAVDAVLDRARAFGVPKVRWEVRLGSPADLVAELTARGATRALVLDVLACDLRGGAPTLPPASVAVRTRWATDFETARDGATIGVTGFGGTLPPDERIAANAAQSAAAVPGGEGGLLVAYAAGVPSGSGGIVMADGVARLWGGVVVPSARGQGIYRALLDARLSYGVTHGATMALVKGKIDTSGPILRRAGFTAYGREPVYDIPL